MKKTTLALIFLVGVSITSCEKNEDNTIRKENSKTRSKEINPDQQTDPSSPNGTGILDPNDSEDRIRR